MRKFWAILFSIIISFIFVNFASFYMNTNEFRIEYRCERIEVPETIKIYWKYKIGKDSKFKEKNSKIYTLKGESILNFAIHSSIFNSLERIRVDLEGETKELTIKSVSVNGRCVTPDKFFGVWHNVKPTIKNKCLAFIKKGRDPYVISEKLNGYSGIIQYFVFVAAVVILSILANILIKALCPQIATKAAAIWRKHYNLLLILVIALCVYFINQGIYTKILINRPIYTQAEIFYRLFHLSLPEISAAVACATVIAISRGAIRGIFLVVFSMGMIYKFLDTFSFVQFSTHITPDDILIFWKDSFKSLPIFLNFCAKRFDVCILWLAAYSSGAIIYARKKGKVGYLIPAIAAVLPIACLLLPAPAVSLFDEGSVVSIFSSGKDSSKRKYTEDYRYRGSELKVVSRKGLNGRQNIIVLFVESLSSEPSLFFGSANGTDAMPNLDAVASESLAFVNHHSNGYNTDTGNYSFLMGRPYIHGIPFSWSKSLPLPRIFENNGYSTHVFYSSENVGELEKIWRKAGFSGFYDGKDDAYAASERLTFRSVPDGDLLDNVRTRIVDLKEPYFAMVMTSTSHAPFIVPRTRERNYMKTVKYVDREIRRFFRELRKSGFFENGLLIITGDHRAMVPMSGGEREKYGELAMARVPLVIYGKGISPKKRSELTTHASLHAMLQYLALDKAVFYEFASIPTAEDAGTETVFYQKHSPRDRVVVSDGDGTHVYTLDGDDTGTEDRCREKERNERLLYLLRTE